MRKKQLKLRAKEYILSTIRDQTDNHVTIMDFANKILFVKKNWQ